MTIKCLFATFLRITHTDYDLYVLFACRAKQNWGVTQRSQGWHFLFLCRSVI